MLKRILICCVAIALAACSHEPNVPDDTAGVIFLAQNIESTVVMDALFDGRIEPDAAGCLRLASDEPATVIWPKDFQVVARSGVLAIVDDQGSQVGFVGGPFRLGGGVIESLNNIALSAADRQRAAQCPGKYWIVGDVP
ncbi:MAG TPA: hypothetical protein VGD27_16790 [Longimicrobiales bacterium]